MTIGRNSLLSAGTLALAALLVLTGGCTSANRPVRAPKVTAPVAYDEAMALRDWPQTTVTIANGDIDAGPTNATWEYDSTMGAQQPSQRRRSLAMLAEAGVFLGNVVMLPYQIVKDPPTEDRQYEGVIIAPTYSAAVPVPGAEQRPRQIEPTTKPALEGSVLPATPGTTMPSTQPASPNATWRSGDGRSGG